MYRNRLARGGAVMTSLRTPNSSHSLIKSCCGQTGSAVPSDELEAQKTYFSMSHEGRNRAAY